MPKKKIGTFKRYPKTKFSVGKFVPQNPQKYVGDVKNIVYRSSWEHRFMKWLDLHESIVKYSSEELVIPYVHPVDGRVHRYFPDFLVQMKTKEGTIKVMVIEIKPQAQTVEPTVKTRKTKRLLNEVVTYAINKNKWDAAKLFCDKRGWQFQVLTERDLFNF